MTATAIGASEVLFITSSDKQNNKKKEKLHEIQNNFSTISSIDRARYDWEEWREVARQCQANDQTQ